MFEFDDKWKNQIDEFLNSYDDTGLFIQYFYSKSLTLTYDTYLKAIEAGEDKDGKNKEQLNNIIKEHSTLFPESEKANIDIYEFSNFLEAFKKIVFNNLASRRIN